MFIDSLKQTFLVYVSNKTQKNVKLQKRKIERNFFPICITLIVVLFGFIRNIDLRKSHFMVQQRLCPA